MTDSPSTFTHPIGALVLISAMALSGTASALGDLDETARTVEARLDARPGVAMRDLSTGQDWTYNADDRFPVSSTFKSPLCGVVLKRVDSGEEQLDRVVRFEASDLVTYSPVTETRLDSGMTVKELCEAAITTSDNTAGNLLLATMGGPKGLTAALRDINDRTTRLDRWETALNEGLPGDDRDTTTPTAAVDMLGRLLFGDVLSDASEERLADWMIADQVADDLIRASLPEGWEIGDKSGAGGFGFRSIVSVIWPPGGGPVLAAIYTTENDADMLVLNEAIAEIGAAMVREIEGR